MSTASLGAASRALLCTVIIICASTFVHAAEAENPAVSKLRQEVAKLGWIIFSARSPAGDYDLFICRPDGSSLRNLTDTPQTSEYGAKLSPDGRRLLYRRIAKGESINHDLWGQFGTLVLADVDGKNPVAQGKDGEYPWACWGPDGKQISCLYKRQGKIQIIDLQSRKIVRELPRQGVFQQLFWSADGKQFCGTANVAGQDWNIVTIDVESGQSRVISRELNCTPDWFNRSSAVIYSNRTPGLADSYGFTILMRADADGKNRTLVYGQKGKHVYFGCTSPDDRYVIFSLMPRDSLIEAPMALMRLDDGPIVAPGYPELQAIYPNAKDGPVLHLTNVPEGFEPQWTFAKFEGE